MEHPPRTAQLPEEMQLPLTGRRSSTVVTDLAVFTIDKHGNDGMALIELATASRSTR